MKIAPSPKGAKPAPLGSMAMAPGSLHRLSAKPAQQGTIPPVAPGRATRAPRERRRERPLRHVRVAQLAGFPRPVRCATGAHLAPGQTRLVQPLARLASLASPSY